MNAITFLDANLLRLFRNPLSFRRVIIVTVCFRSILLIWLPPNSGRKFGFDSVDLPGFPFAARKSTHVPSGLVVARNVYKVVAREDHTYIYNP